MDLDNYLLWAFTDCLDDDSDGDDTDAPHPCPGEWVGEVKGVEWDD